ncbi:MFS transporter [bacterium]|jgi:MFS transporter, YQGE family, putative transporter|nr:MFS transporter [bacterium]MBT4251620.1 MFS transporter [bacterium]MBT4597669.1 MFS transporter [bacterium]MBT6753682.1 MFS transporter [bacterium]MBT7037819.1 MFS transporter [bacterium]
MHAFHHQTHLHIPHCLESLKKDINGIYIIHSIRGFVFSLFGIFIPIYLLTLGFSISMVLFFFVVRQLAILSTNFFVGMIANRLGLKHTMLISLPLSLIYLLLLPVLDSFPNLYLFYGLAIVSGAQAALYWVPMHSLFARSTKTGSRSSQVGKLISFQHIASMLAPLLGGTITLFYSFEILFIIAIILLLIPIGLLLYTPEIKPHINFSFRRGFKLLKKYKRHYYLTCSEIIGGTTESVLWPLFVFLVLKNEFSVGVIGTLLGVGTVFFSLLMGNKANQANRSKIVKIAALMLAIVWISKFFAESSIVIYALSVASGFFVIMFSVPHTAETYALAKKEHDIDEFIIFREIPITIGKVSLLLISTLFLSKINLAFIITGINFLFVFFI